MAETLKKAIKVVSDYAKKHNKSYIQVEQKWVSTWNDLNTGEFTFRAYISDFGIFAESPTVDGLILKFEEVSKGITPAPPVIDIDLPF
jgi:hypothetical protein